MLKSTTCHDVVVNSTDSDEDDIVCKGFCYLGTASKLHRNVPTYFRWSIGLLDNRRANKNSKSSEIFSSIWIDRTQLYGLVLIYLVFPNNTPTF